MKPLIDYNVQPNMRRNRRLMANPDFVVEHTWTTREVIDGYHSSIFDGSSEYLLSPTAIGLSLILLVSVLVAFLASGRCRKL
jgi:hypothetical protein